MDQMNEAAEEANRFTRVTVERTRYRGDGSEGVIAHDAYTVERREDESAVRVALSDMARWAGADPREMGAMYGASVVDNLRKERDEVRGLVVGLRSDLDSARRTIETLRGELGDVIRDRDRLKYDFDSSYSTNARLQLELKAGRDALTLLAEGPGHVQRLVDDLEECQRVVMQRDHEIRDLKGLLTADQLNDFTDVTEARMKVVRDLDKMKVARDLEVHRAIQADVDATLNKALNSLAPLDVADVEDAVDRAAEADAENFGVLGVTEAALDAAEFNECVPVGTEVTFLGINAFGLRDEITAKTSHPADDGFGAGATVRLEGNDKYFPVSCITAPGYVGAASVFREALKADGLWTDNGE